MRFKQYLTEMLYNDYLSSEITYRNNLICYLMEMKIRDNDSSIKKISPHKYTFDVNDTEYSFVIKVIDDIPDMTITSVYFGPNDGISFERLDKHNAVDVRKVFEKVITCMIMFINDLKPETFTFSGHDRKLYKLYRTIIPKVDKHKPFILYDIQNNGNGFTFMRK